MANPASSGDLQAPVFLKYPVSARGQRWPGDHRPGLREHHAQRPRTLCRRRPDRGRPPAGSAGTGPGRCTSWAASWRWVTTPGRSPPTLRRTWTGNGPASVF